MSEDLIAALTTIHGIGEAKAQEILEVLEDQGALGGGIDLDGLIAAIPPGNARRAAHAYLREHGHA